MKKGILIALIVSGVLILTGALIGVVGITQVDWKNGVYSIPPQQVDVKEESVDIPAVSATGNTAGGSTSQTGTARTAQMFTGIAYKGSFSDVVITFSDDDQCTVTYPETDTLTYDVTVENGILTIIEEDTSTPADHIGIFWGGQNYKVTVKLPEETYETLNIHSTSGDVSVDKGLVFDEVEITATSAEIRMDADVMKYTKLHATSGDISASGKRAGETGIETTSGNIRVMTAGEDTLGIETNSGGIHLFNAACGMIRLKATSGNVIMGTVKADSLDIHTTSGEIELDDVTVKNEITVRSNSGDVEMEDCDAAALDIETTSGEVELDLLTGKIYDVKTSSGDIRIPASVEGSGTCRVKTTSGDIEIEIGNDD